MGEMIMRGDHIRNDRTDREYVVLRAVQKGGTVTLEERKGKKYATFNDNGYTEVTVRPVGGGKVETWRLK